MMLRESVNVVTHKHFVTEIKNFTAFATPGLFTSSRGSFDIHDIHGFSNLSRSTCF